MVATSSLTSSKEAEMSLITALGVSSLFQQVGKVLWTRKGVRATVVTAGRCTHAELTSGQRAWFG